MTLSEYQRWYVRDEGHWYVSKIKQYNPQSIKEMARGLDLLVQIFAREYNSELFARFETFRPKLNILFKEELKQIPIDEVSRLFASILFINRDLVNLTHLKSVNEKKFKLFNQIEKEFLEGEGFDFFINKYGSDWINRELTIYYRNFKSWLGKFGFWGEYPNRLCFITDIGYEFAKNNENLDISIAIFKHQLRKYQIWNPTIESKYSDYKIKPFYLLLEVISQIPQHYFTKDEYILFINKIKSHNSSEIKAAIQLIMYFRELSAEDKAQYISEIQFLDKKLFRKRARTNFDRLKDSSAKELDLFTFGDIITKGTGEFQSCYTLNNPKALKEELNLFSGTVKFIDFKDKLDWITYLGGMKQITIDEIVEMYLRDGKSVEEIEASLETVKNDVSETIVDKIYEKEIEDYYFKNIHKISEDLEVVQVPVSGRQFRTHIGPIDILCKSKKTDEYVVIELKRAQASDETVGQVLRYMGWVHVNMTESKSTVRGILVGKEFTDSVKYSLIGMQNASFPEIITTFSHAFDELNKPILEDPNPQPKKKRIISTKSKPVKSKRARLS